MVTGHGTYREADDKDRSKANWATHDPTRRDLIFAPPAFFLFFCHRTSGTFGFTRNTSQHFAKPKEPNLQPHKDIKYKYKLDKQCIFTT